MNLLKRQLAALITFLEKADVEYVILGGVAVSLYGEPRFTADIDVSIMLEKGDLDIFIQKAKQHGFRPAHKGIKQLAKKTGVIPMIYSKADIGARCDFIIAENIIEKIALKRGRIKKIGAIKARFVTPEDLIIHKLTALRPQDIGDISGILIHQRDKLDISYIKYWLNKIDDANKRSNLLKLFMDFLKKCRKRVKDNAYYAEQLPRRRRKRRVFSGEKI